MEYSIYDFLTLIGSLGLFLYGMSLMSEALQKVAGTKLRNILAVMTKNRFTGILTGVLITAVIQSSSATTVMVVSFVNAGLLTLLQSITVIMGANIGTTITAWIISIFGFKISIAKIAVPLIGLSIPFIFSSKDKRKSWGEVILGFALLFFGLDMLKNSVPDLQHNPDILFFLTQFTQSGFASVLIFVGIGTLLTIIVQSSSATVAITLIMCSKGWISFELGAAMVLGENIGTTITANIAAIPANISAKRAALAHMTFNIFGVIWMLFLFYPFTKMIISIITQFGHGNPTEITAFANSIDSKTLNAITSNSELTAGQQIIKEKLITLQIATSFGLSLFHTIFNLINTFVMIWFVTVIAKIVSFVIKQKTTDEEFQLQYISTGMLSTSELSVMQAWKEVKVYVDRSDRMFKIVRTLYQEKNENEFVKEYTRIQKYESISDNMEVEIAKYLTKVSDGKLSDDSKHQIQTMLRVISEIESIADGSNNLSKIIKRKREDKSLYTKVMDDNIDLMMNLVQGALQQLQEAMKNDNVSNDELNQSVNLEHEINNFRNQLKFQNINDVNSHKYEYQASVTYMDIIVECEKMGDYIINIVEALNEATTKK
ncbi:MAG: Na/Pi cotransporter family protein [Paludibacter sp.]|nr:Na/Pi cotransporter family protein [Paludibacter sp.]